MINRAMEQILGCRMESCMGKPVTRYLEELDQGVLKRILEGKGENYSTFLTLQDQSVVLSIEPIVVGSEVEGAIISCNRLKRLDINDDAVMKEQYLRGYVAYGTFDDINRNLKDMRKVVERAKILCPVLQSYANRSNLRTRA